MHGADMARVAAVEGVVRRVLRVGIGAEQDLEDLGAGDAPRLLDLGRQAAVRAHVRHQRLVLGQPRAPGPLQPRLQPQRPELRQHLLNRAVHRLEGIGERAVPIEEQRLRNSEARHG